MIAYILGTFENLKDIFLNVTINLSLIYYAMHLYLQYYEAKHRSYWVGIGSQPVLNEVYKSLALKPIPTLKSKYHTTYVNQEVISNWNLLMHLIPNLIYQQ